MFFELPLGAEKWIEVSKCFQGILFYHLDHLNWSHMGIYARKKKKTEGRLGGKKKTNLIYGLTQSHNLF